MLYGQDDYMNNNYNNIVFLGSPIYTGNNPSPKQQNMQPAYASEIPIEQSYIENILRQNKGKKVIVYASFGDAAPEYKSKTFSGIIEESGRDHVILSNPTTGKWTLILMIYIDYIEFDEKINYNAKFVDIG